MCYVITDGEHYINSTGGQHIVNSINQATKIITQEKANNVLKSLPKILNKYEWEIKTIEDVVKPKEIDYDFMDKISEIESFAKDLNERKIYLQAKLQRVEMEIVDIEHAMEFYTLNAAQGYKIYKMYHDTKVERREVKDELQKIEYILTSNMQNALNNRISKSIIEVDNKQYTPRVLKELFSA